MFKHGFHVVVGLISVVFKICSSFGKTATTQKTDMNLFFQILLSFRCIRFTFETYWFWKFNEHGCCKMKMKAISFDNVTKNYFATLRLNKKKVTIKKKKRSCDRKLPCFLVLYFMLFSRIISKIRSLSGLG